MVKIAIVGPQEDKWNKEQKEKAKEQIYLILANHNRIAIENKDTVTIISGHCPKGGVDIWVEEIANELHFNIKIYKPEVNQWEDRYPTEHESPYIPYRMWMGYKSRNIKIAKDCDILYCIVPYNWDNFNMRPPYDDYSWCRHCKVWRHPTNGGCWTMNYAKKIGKDTHLIVVGSN